MIISWSKWSVKEPTRIHHLKKLEMRLRSVAFWMVRISSFFHVPFRTLESKWEIPVFLAMLLWTCECFEALQTMAMLCIRKKLITCFLTISFNVRQPNSGSALLPLWVFETSRHLCSSKNIALQKKVFCTFASPRGCKGCLRHETFCNLTLLYCCTVSRYITVQHST